MGANASSAGREDAGEEHNRSGGPSDYYELLGVEVEATSDEIRKAFRREALKWHPDKNAGSEEASKRFVKIQAAYDVLSDNQERAYYDSHRGDIDDDSDGDIDLRERARQASNAKQSVRISAKQLVRFFDASIFNNDFSDSPNGFFTIYATLFETINESEYYATAPAGEPALAPAVQYPVFGNSKTKYDAPGTELKRFYSSYLSFASRRPFNEADKYRLQDAPDRQIRRMMERENKRYRDDARKEYNEAVRSLASFLKKRDPRFLNSASSDPVKLKQLEKKRLEAQLREAALEAAKKREEAAKAFVEQDWMKVQTSSHVADEWSDGAEAEEADANGDAEEEIDGQAQNGHEQIDGDDVDEEEEEVVDDWYCAACDKMFNSQGAWDNHERSRKHVQNTKRLKKEMLAEDEELAASQELETPSAALTPAEVENGIDDLERAFRQLSKKERKRLQRHLPFEAEPEAFDEVALEAEEDPLKDEEITSLQERQTVEDGVAEQNDGEPGLVVPQLSKRDKRKAREAAKKASQENDASEEICRICSTTFSSRTKLFSHIQETGHATATGEAPVSHSQGKKRGKRK